MKRYGIVIQEVLVIVLVCVVVVTIAWAAYKAATDNKPKVIDPISGSEARGRIVEVYLHNGGYIAYLLEVDGVAYLLNVDGGVIEHQPRAER